MKNIVYNEQRPNSERDLYTSGNTVDFSINFNGRAIIPNSIYLTGKIAVYNGNSKTVAVGGNVSGAQSIFIDPMIGAHSLIDIAVSRTETADVVENLANYARYVKMHNSGTLNDDDYFRSDLKAALCAPTNSQQLNQLIQCGTVYNSVKRADTDFMFKPDVALNRMMTKSPVPFQKTGQLTLSLKLADDNKVLFGSQVTNQITYGITDLKVFYLTTDVFDGSNVPIQMRVVGYKAPEINSKYAVINIKSPLTADSLVMSFIDKTRDVSLTENTQQLEFLPGLEFVEYIFNDATNGQISYKVDNVPEMMKYTEDAFKSVNNNFSVAKLTHNRGFCLGYNFGFKQLTNSKISLQLKSNISSDYQVYVFLNGVIEI